MGGDGQSRTKAVYEDAGVVRVFQEAHATSPAVGGRLEAFAAALPGKQVIDVGCGPGRDAWHLARLGLEVTAVDYSEAMLRAARAAGCSVHPPRFLRLDMRALGESFPAGSFDGAWVCASLIHVPEADVPAVLDGVARIVAPGGLVHFTLKGGPQGAALVREHKYGREIGREFIFWERSKFETLLRAHGFRLNSVDESTGGMTGGVPTRWLRIDAEVVS